MEPESLPLVRVGATADGAVTYWVDLSPEALPPVRGRDLEAAWDAAREAAMASRWGLARGFRFRRRDGSYTDLALSDRDARCWAGAVEKITGMHTSYGVSLCLRLLALIELLARVRWTTGLLRLRKTGAELDASLLRVAASAPLTAEARFDEMWFRDRLTHVLLERPFDRERLLGASA